MCLSCTLSLSLSLSLPSYSHTPHKAITDSFNSNTSKLHEHFSDTELYLAVAIYAIGGMTGALLSGILADYIGRYNEELAHPHEWLWHILGGNLVPFVAQTHF